MVAEVQMEAPFFLTVAGAVQVLLDEPQEVEAAAARMVRLR